MIYNYGNISCILPILTAVPVSLASGFDEHLIDFYGKCKREINQQLLFRADHYQNVMVTVRKASRVTGLQCIIINLNFLPS